MDKDFCKGSFSRPVAFIKAAEPSEWLTVKDLKLKKSQMLLLL